MLVPWGLNLGLGQSLSLRYREKLQDLRSRLCVCGFHSDVGQKLLDFHRFSVFVFIFYSSCKARSSTSRPRWAELEVWEATNSISRVEGKFAAINKWMCSCFPSIKCVLFDVYGTVISSALTPEGLFFLIGGAIWLGSHVSGLPLFTPSPDILYVLFRILLLSNPILSLNVALYTLVYLDLGTLQGRERPFLPNKCPSD